MDNKVKKDFLIYTTFLLSRGFPHSGQVLKYYTEDSILFSYDDIPYLEKVSSNDKDFREVGDNFVSYLKFLLVNETDPIKSDTLRNFFTYITDVQSYNFSIASLN